MKAKAKSSDVVKRPIYQFAVPPAVMNIEESTLTDCIATAIKRDGFVVVKQNGEAVALLEPFDQEQYELGIDKEFWKMMEERRKGPRISQEEMERRLGLKPYKPKAKRKSSAKPKAKKAVVK